MWLVVVLKTMWHELGGEVSQRQTLLANLRAQNEDLRATPPVETPVAKPYIITECWHGRPIYINDKRCMIKM